MSHSILLLPFIFAFGIFTFRFYVRENAASMANPSFLLALGTVVAAALYLVLGVLGSLPPYSALAFGLTGLVLLGVSIARMFVI
jgi:quinol-cytochrome oxidoreductase complex cytochrome b subunit